MDSTMLHFEIEGTCAKEAADELASYIATELQTVPQKSISRPGTEATDKSGTKDAAIISAAAAAITVVISIPASALAIHQLLDRQKKKEGVEKVIEKVKTIKKEQKISTLRLRIGKAELSIERATYATITDYLEK